MPPLDPKDFPEFKESTITAINELSEEQLHVEVEKKSNSRFGAKKQPLLSAALAQRRGELKKIDNELNPQPPAFFQHILWVLKYGFKYWYILLIALIVTLSPYIYDLYQSSIKEKINNPLHSTVQPSQPEASKGTKAALSAPNIRFSDSTFGTVELSVEARLDPERLIATHTLYGSAEAAINSLLTSLRSATINNLETKSQDYVRAHREQIAKEIIEKTKDAQHRTGYIISEFSIGEIH